MGGGAASIKRFARRCRRRVFAVLYRWRDPVTGILLVGAAALALVVALYPRFLDQKLARGPGFDRGAFNGLVALTTISALVALADKIWSAIKDKTRVQNAAFFAQYTDLVATATNALQDISNYDEARVGQAQELALKAVCQVVLAFYGKQQDPLINASLMRPSDPQRWAPGGRLKDAVRWVDHGRRLETHSTVLQLIRWADEGKRAAAVGDEFALPVVTSREYLLFGAPKAYVTGETQIIADTWIKRLSPGRSPTSPRSFAETCWSSSAAAGRQCRASSACR